MCSCSQAARVLKNTPLRKAVNFTDTTRGTLSKTFRAFFKGEPDGFKVAAAAAAPSGESAATPPPTPPTPPTNSKQQLQQKEAATATEATTAKECEDDDIGGSQETPVPD